MGMARLKFEREERKQADTFEDEERGLINESYALISSFTRARSLERPNNRSFTEESPDYKINGSFNLNESLITNN